jgi:hypothetical protein
MANLLDNLFQWAAQQPTANITSVNLAMTGSENANNCLVSYADGTLFYKPPSHSGLFHLPANFSSKANGIKQYFSDRTFGTGLGGNPFNPDDTDPLDVIIGPEILSLSTNYVLTIHSSKYNLSFTVGLKFDATTEVIYATNGPTFITVSLCGQNSIPPRA